MNLWLFNQHQFYSGTSPLIQASREFPCRNLSTKTRHRANPTAWNISHCSPTLPGRTFNKVCHERRSHRSKSENLCRKKLILWRCDRILFLTKTMFYVWYSNAPGSSSNAIFKAGAPENPRSGRNIIPNVKKKLKRYPKASQKYMKCMDWCKQE